MYDYKGLSKVFSPVFLKKMAQNQHLDELNALMKDHVRYRNLIKKNNYRVFYNELYRQLLKEYKFEYLYKNEVYFHILETNKISSSDGILTEVKADNNIADFVYLNGTSKVYEIKTEIDNNKRLLDQIESYFKLFKEVTVVTYPENVNKIMEMVPEYVGIMTLTNIGTFNIIRDAKENLSNLNKRAMFQTLRRKEYEYIILNKFETLPFVSDAEIYERCFDLFNELSTSEAHELLIEQLKARTNKSLLRRSKRWPKSLSLLIENSKLKSNDREHLMSLFN